MPTDAGLPSPALVAAWLTLEALPAERVPQWAAGWLVHGYDGPALAELAGLHGDDPREIRDQLPAALAECGAALPDRDTATAMDAFTRLARLHADGKAHEQWIAGKVDEILAGLADPAGAMALPLGRRRDLTRQACREQLELAYLR